MYIADTHCDTLTEIFDKGYNLFQNSLHIDIKRMKSYSHFTQVFACFISPEHSINAKDYAINVFSYFFNEIEKNCDYIEIAKNHEEYRNLKKEGKIAAFLSIEGGEAIEEMSDVDFFYELGVRMIALTWNYDNKIASGVLGNEKRGITEYGKKIIKRMNEKKMLVDVSHLNEKSFWDVCEVNKGALVASHSNSYSVCKNPRNLKDEQFEIIKNANGYVGINLYPDFLTQDKKANVCDVLKNIEYFLSLNGEDIVGLGCDFDGVDYLPDKFYGVESLEYLFNEMAKIGYSQRIIDKIAHKNWEKMINLF